MKTYNGWTNYETWNVKLWIDNEEPSYRYWQETATEFWRAAEAVGVFTRSEQARSTLAERLEEEVADGSPLADTASMYHDLLGAALSDVNWGEIANSLLDDCDGYEACEYDHVEPIAAD